MCLPEMSMSISGRMLGMQRMMITFLAHLEEGSDKIRESMEKHLLGGNEGNDPVAKNR